MTTVRPAQFLVVVDRGKFRVHVWKRPPLSGHYTEVWTLACAVGARGHRTPAGLYAITDKKLRPDWVIPESDWTDPKDWGKRIPYGDPRNPLRGAFLGLGDTGGVGLHGTDNIGSLGTAASHGCIRLYEDSAVKLYHLLPKETPVYIV